MQYPDECKGCLITIHDDVDCDVDDELKEECPCQTCLIKMICDKPCDEWFELSASYYHADGHWIRK